MAENNNERARFRDFLREQGLKLTRQRLQVFDLAMSLDRHFGVEELARILRLESRRIAKSTVYRTVRLLVQAGFLEAHDFDRGHTLYERKDCDGHHDHLICLSCESVFEFHSAEIEELQESITLSLEFRMLSHTHQIYGVCAECRSKGARVEHFTGT